MGRMVKSIQYDDFYDGFYHSFCRIAVVRSTDSEQSDSLERATQHWRKRRSMYQATDSADSMSESEEVSSFSHTLSAPCDELFCYLGSVLV